MMYSLSCGKAGYPKGVRQRPLGRNPMGLRAKGVAHMAPIGVLEDTYNSYFVVPFM